MAQDVWYYAVDDRREGPVDGPAIDRMWREGKIGPGTLVWRDGMSDWEPAADVLGSRPTAASTPRAASVAGAAPGQSPPAPAGSGARDYHESVGLSEAMRRAINHYVDFSGRANRGEFWWFVLGSILIASGLAIVDYALFGSAEGLSPLSNLWSLATFLPSLAVSVRRLHDTDRSGWWLLLGLIPIVGQIFLIVWYAQQGEPRPNRFG